MFHGMKDRMKKEIQALAPSPMGPEVEAPPNRKYSCWLGGAILSQIDKFEPMWITKKEYEEAGGGKIVHLCTGIVSIKLRSGVDEAAKVVYQYRQVSWRRVAGQNTIDKARFAGT